MMSQAREAGDRGIIIASKAILPVDVFRPRPQAAAASPSRVIRSCESSFKVINDHPSLGLRPRLYAGVRSAHFR